LSYYAPVWKDELGRVALDVCFFHAELALDDGSVEFGYVVIYIEFF
jgi:hypothetical protein